jgi:hypothetical protein
MPIFLVPDASQSNYGIGICDRCRMKRFLIQLKRDPNYPGLRVCDPEQVRDGCLDKFDPWRLPPRQTERINLPFVRPDVPISDPAPPLSVQEILAKRLVDSQGRAILDSQGRYIDATIPGGPILNDPNPA